MRIRMVTSGDVDGWVNLRAELWADSSFENLRAEAAAMLAKPVNDGVVFVAVDDVGSVRGFAEASLRHDFVNGCETSPVAFLEGIYVRRENRGAGLGRRLSTAVLTWAREQGCAEIASDALLENIDSHAFHAAIGFEETERVVYFRKTL